MPNVAFRNAEIVPIERRLSGDRNVRVGGDVDATRDGDGTNAGNENRVRKPRGLPKGSKNKVVSVEVRRIA